MSTQLTDKKPQTIKKTEQNVILYLFIYFYLELEIAATLPFNQ